MQSSSYVIPGTFQQMIVELIETPVKFPPDNGDCLPPAPRLTLTGNPLDIAIQGGGYFQVILPSGATVFTRYGSFRLDDRNRVVTQDGNLIVPVIALPIGADGLDVSPSGLVTAQFPGLMVTMPSGQFHLVGFANVDALVDIGGGLFQQNKLAESPHVSAPDYKDVGTGKLLQYFLETDLANTVKNCRNATGHYKSDPKTHSALPPLVQPGLGHGT